MRAIVIGAGIGGIAAAIRTAKLGYEVTVFESSNGPGGKLSSFEQDGYRFDRGPSLFTMPHYVDQLFELCGENPADHFQYTREEVVCRYFWDEGQRLIAYADPDQFSKEAAAIFSVESDLVRKALAASERKYSASGKTFLEKPLHKASTWLSKDVISAMTNLGDMDLNSTMHEVNTSQLKHPKLVQLFDRFATYNGSNPYQAPGILTVIPTFEHLIGTFLPKGGMYDITSSLVALAERQGVKFQYNSPVKGVEYSNDFVTGVTLQDGTKTAADLIVNNADVHFFYQNLMPEARPPTRTLAQERSTSAVIFYWGVKGDYDELGLHNIFFSNDYKTEFEALQAGTIAEDFTVYVNVTSKQIEGESPSGNENWFVMVNAPYDRDQDWEKELDRIRTHTIAKLSKIMSRDLASSIETERTWTPPGIQADTGSYLGALYGTSSNSRFAAFFRHRNESKQFKNLYFVGGSVHPGGGVPLALLSAKIAAELMPRCT